MPTTKEETLRLVLRNLIKLQNEFHVPLLFAYYSKIGIVPFGSDGLVQKFTDEIKNEEADEESWKETFDTDQDSINNGVRYDEQVDAYIQSQGQCPPARLPADIDLMVFNELHPAVSAEILKWYWQQGGTRKLVNYGHPDFNADFWPESWPWEEVKKCFGNLRKEDYKGPGNITEFLRTALKNRFESELIDPSQYISKDFSEKERKNRERHRGLHRQPEAHLDEEPLSEQFGGEPARQHVGQPEIRVELEDSESNMDDDVFNEIEDAISLDDSFNDGNDNLERVTIENATDEEIDNNIVNMSDVVCPDLMDLIEDEIGLDLPASILSGMEDSLERPNSARNRKSPNLSKTFKPKRKLPSEMNNSRMPPNFPSGSRISSSGPRIPCKEPRRIQVTNEASPIRNFGMCETPPRLPPRFPRNDSQRTSSLSDRLEQLLRLKIAFNLIETFKELSGYNTLLKKETGAILAGRRQEESYLVDTIFLPQQDGFSDRFQTTDEGEADLLNFFQENPNLVLLGVIHTHPGFDSFLSSVDLHMLFNYATSNHAVVSIVLAPELNTFPAFTLTRKGMEALPLCKEAGFHRHNKTGLYAVAHHVEYVNIPIRVEDRR